LLGVIPAVIAGLSSNWKPCGPRFFVTLTGRVQVLPPSVERATPTSSPWKKSADRVE